MIAAERNAHEASIHRRERIAQSLEAASLDRIAPIANANGTVIPT